MRLVSQNGEFDVPYEIAALSRIGNIIIAYVPIVGEKGTIMARYSTEEKAKKVMEVICNVYPEFEKANIVFRFPKDDEI